MLFRQSLPNSQKALHRQRDGRHDHPAPVLINLTMFVLRPIAHIAATIKNLLTVFNGAKKSGETPAATAAVVTTDAAIKYKINIGKTDFSRTFSPSAFALRAAAKAKISVIGMMASVRVSLTITALSNVSLPNPYRESQTEASPKRYH